MTLHVVPLTEQNWPDLETLFGPKGACGGCWCMAWRLPHKLFVAQKGEANHNALFEIVRSGAPTGVLAYRDGQPIGWCAVAPREATPRLEKSRVLARVDRQPVWSITCLYVAKQARRQGVSTRLIEAAADFAASRGAHIVEGYPTQPTNGKLPDPFVWTGLPSAFERAGFKEVARRSRVRPIMRRVLENSGELPSPR